MLDARSDIPGNVTAVVEVALESGGCLTSEFPANLRLFVQNPAGIVLDVASSVLVPM